MIRYGQRIRFPSRAAPGYADRLGHRVWHRVFSELTYGLKLSALLIAGSAPTFVLIAAIVTLGGAFADEAIVPFPSLGAGPIVLRSATPAKVRIPAEPYRHR